MINKVILVGNLGKDPEVRFTQGGQAVCNFSMATSRSWTDKNGGGKKEETEWHQIEVWGKQAEACGEYLAKGRTVYVEGRLKTDTWDDKKTGEKKYKVKVVAENVRFLGGKGGGKPRDEGEQQQSGLPDTDAPAPGLPAQDAPDDIPF